MLTWRVQGLAHVKQEERNFPYLGRQAPMDDVIILVALAC